ncbi:hypothetical protein [Gordonia soli]|uniref:Head-to-tail stopper n=1 Tax=Gordonia soli NBRC 108243 TaxID=1223545 RepID=M0QPW2_9ACTN|nr:hypothetical protein [Gordonia soli]GAC70730.1 hypothetical protein GS4_39_00610 [Gordonia soli NBRC 108243]
MLFDSIAVDRIGGDVVVILKRGPQLDDDGNVIRDDLNDPVQAERLIPKTGCSFDELRVHEEDASTLTNTVTGRVLMPFDADTNGITAADALIFDGRMFEMQGPRQLVTNLDGTPNHVLCTCWWIRGDGTDG